MWVFLYTFRSIHNWQDACRKVLLDDLVSFGTIGLLSNRYDFQYHDENGLLSTHGPAICLIEVKSCSLSPDKVEFYMTENEMQKIQATRPAVSKLQNGECPVQASVELVHILSRPWAVLCCCLFVACIRISSCRTGVAFFHRVISNQPFLTMGIGLCLPTSDWGLHVYLLCFFQCESYFISVIASLDLSDFRCIMTCPVCTRASDDRGCPSMN